MIIKWKNSPQDWLTTKCECGEVAGWYNARAYAKLFKISCQRCGAIEIPQNDRINILIVLDEFDKLFVSDIFRYSIGEPSEFRNKT